MPREIENGVVRPVDRYPRPASVPGTVDRNYVESPGKPIIGDLHRYFAVIRARRWLVLTSVIACGMAGLLYSVRQTPVYRASTTVEITGLDEGVVGRADSAARSNRYPDDNYVQTQVELLHSRALLARVLSRLGLRYETQSTGTGGATTMAGRVMAVFRHAPRDPLTISFESLAVRANRLTRVIEISFESHDPQTAADVANGIAAEYISRDREVRWDTAQQNSEWLNGKLGDLRQKLSQSEDAMQRYAANSGLLYTGDKTSISMEKLREMQGDLSRAEAELATKRSRYESAATAAPDSVPEILDDPALREHQMKLAELRRQLADISTLLTPENYKVARLQAQIDELDELFRKQRTNILNRVQVEYEAARRKEAMLATAYAAQDKAVHADELKGIRYDLLRREADANRQLYDSLLQKIRENSVISAMNGNSIRVVDPARLPTVPVRPNARLNMLLGLISGLFLGLMAAFVVETGDQGLRAPGEGNAYLNVPELGTVPSLDTDPMYAKFRKSRQLPRGTSLLDVPDAERFSDLAVWHSQHSFFTESIRAAAMSLEFARVNGASPRVLVITSAFSKEGKSTIASNLAISFARINRRTLIVDGDTRRPRLHQMFGLQGRSGLTDLLLDSEAIDVIPASRLAYPTEVPNLYVLPAGEAANASDLLPSDRMAKLLRRLRRQFEIVIIDTPPMAQIPDARILGQLADGVVLLVRAGVTSREMAQTVLDRLAQDGTPVFGTILNDWTPLRSNIARYYRYTTT